MTTFIGNIKKISYYKGTYEGITGVKQKNQKRMTDSGFKGSNGTYSGVTNSPVCNTSIEIGNISAILNIRSFLMESLGIKKFTDKRISIIESNIPKHVIEFKKNSKKHFEIDNNGVNTKKWIKHLKSML